MTHEGAIKAWETRKRNKLLKLGKAPHTESSGSKTLGLSKGPPKHTKTRAGDQAAREMEAKVKAHKEATKQKLAKQAHEKAVEADAMQRWAAGTMTTQEASKVVKDPANKAILQTAALGAATDTKEALAEQAHKKAEAEWIAANTKAQQGVVDAVMYDWKSGHLDSLHALGALEHKVHPSLIPQELKDHADLQQSAQVLSQTVVTAGEANVAKLEKLYKDLSAEWEDATSKADADRLVKDIQVVKAQLKAAQAALLYQEPEVLSGTPYSGLPPSEMHRARVEDALGSWKGNPEEVRKYWAMQQEGRGKQPDQLDAYAQGRMDAAMALQEDLERAGVNTRTLYRGGVSTPGKWEGYSENPQIARNFAMNSGNPEAITIVDPGEAVALDIGAFPNVGNYGEAEWIVRTPTTAHPPRPKHPSTPESRSEASRKAAATRKANAG